MVLGWGFWFWQRRRKGYEKYRIYALMAGIVGLVCLIARILEWCSPEVQGLNQVDRNPAGEGSEEILLLMDAGELLEKYSYTLTVEEQLVTDSEAMEIFQAAEKELEQVILGENDSVDNISGKLFLPEQLQKGLVTVNCSFEPSGLVDTDGEILWENVKQEKEMVKAEALLECQGREEIYEFYLQLVPPPPGAVEGLLTEVNRQIKQENQRQGQGQLKLPQEVDGIALSWYPVTDSDHEKLLVLGMILMVGYYVYQKEKRDREIKRRKQGLSMNYPEIVSQISLLTGAGMTVSGAWGKLSVEYRERRKEKKGLLQPGYEEMLGCWYEMQDGISELKAYENFGMRCGLPEYRKFTSILIQSVRKGSKGMQQLLDAEAQEAFQQRKAKARQLGEEAGTKMLLPMGLMLVLVFVILIVPAILTMNV